MRLPKTIGLLAVALLAVAFTAPALAQSGLGELTQRLRESGDFRVRTQAALALGASRDKQAVPALCGALGDANTTVRAAAAAALGRLVLGGSDCLRARLGAELSQDVLAVIRRALERLEAPQKPAITSSTRYYLAIGQPTNDTTRSTGALDQVVRKALSKQLSALVGIVIAPTDETPAQAKALLEKHPHVKAIFVWPKVKALYAGGALKLSFDLSLFTYPGKAFKGNMYRSLTMPDTLAGDLSGEDQLIEMAAERMAPDLEKTAARL